MEISPGIFLEFCLNFFFLVPFLWHQPTPAPSIDTPSPTPAPVEDLEAISSAPVGLDTPAPSTAGATTRSGFEGLADGEVLNIFRITDCACRNFSFKNVFHYTSPLKIIFAPGGGGKSNAFPRFLRLKSKSMKC